MLFRLFLDLCIYSIWLFAIFKGISLTADLSYSKIWAFRDYADAWSVKVWGLFYSLDLRLSSRPCINLCSSSC